MIDLNILKIDKILARNVSRETLRELEDYSKEIIIRNSRINLISKNTEKSIKSRHIEDSAQTIDFIDKNDIEVCTDLGSGAGFPGIVLGILMKSKNHYLKQSYMRKAIIKALSLKKCQKNSKLTQKFIEKNIFEQKI